MTGPQAITAFALGLLVLFSAYYAAMRADGRRRTDSEGVVWFTAGVWINKWSASWPLARVELHPDRVEIRPRFVPAFRPVCFHRETVEHVVARRVLFDRGIKLVGRNIVTSLTIWPANPHAFSEEWARQGWPSPGSDA